MISVRPSQNLLLPLLGATRTLEGFGLGWVAQAH
jgi:hypothetical protein